MVKEYSVIMSSSGSRKDDGYEDALTLRKAFNPVWIFSDLYGGRHCGSGFWCFLNGHYPAGLVSLTLDTYKAAFSDITEGKWYQEWKLKYPEKPIAWGMGRSPSEAFRSALKMAVAQPEWKLPASKPLEGLVNV